MEPLRSVKIGTVTILCVFRCEGALRDGAMLSPPARGGI